MRYNSRTSLKYILSSLLIGMCSTPLFAATNPPMSPLMSLLSDPPPAVQAFHRADEKIKNSNNNRQLLAQVSPQNDAPTVTVPQPSLTPSLDAAEQQQFQSLQTKLDLFNQLSTIQEQRLDNHIAAIQQEYQLQEQQIREIGQNLTGIRDDLYKLERNAAAPKGAMQSATGLFENTAQKQIFWMASILGLVMLVLTFFALGNRSRNKAISKAQAKATVARNAPNKEGVSKEGTSEQEYDYLNSAEGLASKLDLAQAYITMEDYKSARDLLRQVLATGNIEQRHRAEKLLSRIIDANLNV